MSTKTKVKETYYESIIKQGYNRIKPESKKIYFKILC